jgi:hypothetical protein
MQTDSRAELEPTPLGHHQACLLYDGPPVCNQIVYYFFSLPIHQLFHLHSSVNGQPDWFHSLAIVNSITINIGVPVFLFYVDLHSFSYMTGSGTAGYWGSSSFLRNPHSNFCSGWTNLHSHLQCSRLPFLYHPPSTTSPACVVCFLTGVRWNLSAKPQSFYLSVVVYPCNFSYQGGRKEDCSLRPVQAKVWDPI